MFCTSSRVTRPHGNSGVVKGKFSSNLPPHAFGASVRVVRFLSSLILAPAHGVHSALVSRCFTPPTSKHSPSLPFRCRHCCYTLMYCKSYDMLHDCMHIRTVKLLSMCEPRRVSFVAGQSPKGRAVIWLSWAARKQLVIRFHCQSMGVGKILEH